MKIGLAVILLVVVAFFIGRGQQKDLVPPEEGQTRPLRASNPHPSKSANSRDPSTTSEEARATLERGGNLTTEQCLALTREERVEMLQRGALIYDDLKQADFLIALIGTLDKEELAEARKYLGRAQGRGNRCAQAVWDVLWKQAGRVAPLQTLENYGRYKGRNDARRIMAGWFETDAAAALAWAKGEPESDEVQYAQSAAYALTLEADGDPAKLLQTLNETELNDRLTREVLLDYFDLAEAVGAGGGAAAVYEALPTSLQAEAWEVALQRISYDDKEAALEWLADHSDDAGFDIRQTTHLMAERAQKDPAQTTIWAAELTISPDEKVHPVEVSFREWKRRDAAAAEAWLKTMPADTPWVQRLSN